MQRGYSIPDVELRESLKRDNKEYIIPKYNAFYNMWVGYLNNKKEANDATCPFFTL